MFNWVGSGREGRRPYPPGGRRCNQLPFLRINYISVKDFANACDSGNRDVASMMIETEVAVADNLSE